MSALLPNKDVEERKIRMSSEKNILLKLTELLEKENLISAEEKNRAVMMIRQEDT